MARLPVRDQVGDRAREGTVADVMDTALAERLLKA